MVARNLRHTMTSYARSSESGEVTEAPGVLMVNSGVPYAVFNSALLTESFSGDITGIERTVRLAADHYRRRRLPWSCWTCDDFYLDGVRDLAPRVFGRLGLRMVAEHQGMIADRVAPLDRPLPAMEVREVKEDATRRDFVRVAADVFYVPGKVAGRVYGSDRFWRGHMVGWVGYVQGRPVSIAATDTDAAAVGVYSVGTISGLRGRGYGECVTRHAVESAQRATGHHRSTLQSTLAGLALYRRLGYRPASRFSVYVSE
jgi:ribosomal protein S18 acetylase RimI-like enzyme